MSNGADSSAKQPHIVIVGGSLTGLTCALALARYGLRSTVIERVEARERTGGGLWVDGPLLEKVTGLDARSSNRRAGWPVQLSQYAPTSWIALHDLLRESVLREQLVTLIEGAQVDSVSDGQTTVFASTASGDVIFGDLLIGCDGYRSLVRTVVNPEKPEASYAGYLLWRGLVNERELPRGTKWAGEGFGSIERAEYRLVAYPVAGIDGSQRPGERQVSFAWYDAHRLDLLRSSGCVSEEGFVLRTVTPAMIPTMVQAELEEFALESWPAPWRDVVVHAIRENMLFGTPIAQYEPPAVARGRLALAGDAAHVVSPLTGRGFQTGLEDAASVAQACDENFKRNGVVDSKTLWNYSAHRLSPARALARKSIELSREYLQAAAADRSRQADFISQTSA